MVRIDTKAYLSLRVAKGPESNPDEEFFKQRPPLRVQPRFYLFMKRRVTRG